jgi:hypothetical protein
MGAKSPDDKKIVVMATKINALKGQLKLDPKLSATLQRTTRKGTTKVNTKRIRKQRTRRTSNKKFQKRDKEWKKVPPKDKDPKEKQVGRFTFQWCERHMVWTAHKPQDHCRLNPKHKDYQGGKKGDHKAHSVVVASSAMAPSATTTLNNCYVALLATIGTMQNEKRWCMPACIWNMLVCVAGPLDTGQLLTYLYILLLPVIVLNLICLAYPTKFVAKVITKSAPWHLRGRPRAFCRTRVKRYKIPE